MELLEILATLVVVVVAMLLATSVVTIDREQLAETRREFRERSRTVLPFLSVLGFVLLFNAQFRVAFADLSQLVGFHITPQIYRVEGSTIVLIQSFFGDQLASFFSFMYVYGYVFVLVFPLVAYFVLDRLDTFKSLTIAYTANYVIGLVCYVLFVVFGPRNTIPDLVEVPLYTEYSHFQLLTREVNRYTNVFPSLHTSLSVTVILFAWRTRESYPRWLLIATFFGTSVVMSTMYLAIHWVIDVIAGIALALLCYWIGLRAVDEQWGTRLAIRRRWGQLWAALR